MSKTVDQILDDRKVTHGDYSDVAEDFINLLKIIDNRTDNFKNVSQACQTAIVMICMKLARIANGDPNEPDHYCDIAGYATLAKNCLENE